MYRRPSVRRALFVASVEYCTMKTLQQQDPGVWGAIVGAMQRQHSGLEMIASENYASPAVVEGAWSGLEEKEGERYNGKQ